MSDSEESTFPLNKRQRLSAPFYNDRSEDEMVTPFIDDYVFIMSLRLVLCFRCCEFVFSVPVLFWSYESGMSWIKY